MTEQLKCAFVFAYAKSRLPHDEAHILSCQMNLDMANLYKVNQALHKSYTDINFIQVFIYVRNELHCEKTSFLYMRKQRRRPAAQ